MHTPYVAMKNREPKKRNGRRAPSSLPLVHSSLPIVPSPFPNTNHTTTPQPNRTCTKAQKKKLHYSKHSLLLIDQIIAHTQCKLLIWLALFLVKKVIQHCYAGSSEVGLFSKANFFSETQSEGFGFFG